MLLLPSLFLLGLTSCTSEYEERMEIAKTLKDKIETARSTNESQSMFLNEEISELESKIYFHAKVSGNEALFIKELFQQ